MRILALITTLAMVLALATCSSDSEDESDSEGEIAGGQMYDKWWTVTGAAEPESDSPLWSTQTTNERSGADTWRCKECHGWDYKGADGAYGSGSHFTGFTGIFASQDEDADTLTGAMSGDIADHDFSSVMTDAEIADLVAFIGAGLDDYGQFVAEDKTIIGGDTDNGSMLYGNTCSTCHGTDGTLLNFGDADEPEYLGTIAVDNPWEFFHKVKYGQPGTEMPNADDNDLSLEDIRDIAAYGQTLPTE